MPGRIPCCAERHLNTAAWCHKRILNCGFWLQGTATAGSVRVVQVSRLKLAAAHGVQRQVNNTWETRGWWVICICLAYLHIRGRDAATQSEREEKADVTHGRCIVVAHWKYYIYILCVPGSIKAAARRFAVLCTGRVLRSLMPDLRTLWWCSNENRSSPRNWFRAPLVNVIIMEMKPNVVFLLKCFTESPPGLLILQLNGHDWSFVSTLRYIWQNTPLITLATNRNEILPIKECFGWGCTGDWHV